MERNGRNSCTEYSRHIDIRYFFIKDQVKSGKIKVIYCPTEKRVADFFKRPLKGKVFSMIRKAVMGHDMGNLIDSQA